jgi:hypothetical protein
MHVPEEEAKNGGSITEIDLKNEDSIPEKLVVRTRPTFETEVLSLYYFQKKDKTQKLNSKP